MLRAPNYRHPARDRLGSLLREPSRCLCGAGYPVPQPKLTKLIREPKVRSIKIGRTRLIEKAADVRRMATAAR